MPAFQWEDSYLTGLPAVDEQHWKLVDLLNQFSCLVEEGESVPRERLEAVFQELFEYASYHFVSEEVFMADWDLDVRHRDAHVEAHADFIRQVRQMRAELEAGAGNPAKTLLGFMSHWLAFHILGTDQFMARQIRAVEGGRTPAQAFTEEIPTATGATAALLRSLNGLIEILSFRNQQLVQLNLSLEQRVEERTRDLSLANAELCHAVERLQSEQVESRRLGQELAKANEVLSTLAMTDPLTGLPNRRQAFHQLEAEWSKSVRSQRPLSLVMVDADGFKEVNDGFGHDAGDQVLMVLARALHGCFRAYDLVCRLGGDEFLVICPDTPLEGALAIAERCRRKVEQIRVQLGEGEWRGSISAGVAARHREHTGPDDLVKAADQAVYSAKRLGRNRVEVAPAGVS